MGALSAFQTALATSGINPVDIVCIGDSITEGSVAGTHELAWPQRLRDLLRAHYMCGSIKGGVGYLAAEYATAFIPDAWTTIGSVDVGTLSTGLGERMLKADNREGMTLAFTGTGLDVLYTTGTNSAFSYSVDGGKDIFLDKRIPSGGVFSGNVLQIRGLCEKDHTFVAKGSSSGSAYIEGAMVYRGDETMGIRMWESGHSGFTCADFTNTSRWQGSLSAVPAKKLVIISLGINEYNTGISVASFAATLNTLVLTVKSLLNKATSSVVLMAQHKRMPIDGAPDWSLYENAMQSCATANGCGFLKQSVTIGEPTTAINSGVLQSVTGLHPTATGHAKYAQALLDYLVTP